MMQFCSRYSPTKGTNVAVQIRNKRQAVEELSKQLKESLGARTNHEWYVELTPEGSHPTPAELERIGEARDDLNRRLDKLAGVK